MKLIAVISILNGGQHVAPGGPVELADAEGDVLVKRGFARYPNEAELAQHWPDVAAAQAAAAEAAALAQAEAAAAAERAAAEAQAAADAAAAAEAEAAKAAAEVPAAPAAKTAATTRSPKKAASNG